MSLSGWTIRSCGGGEERCWRKQVAGALPLKGMPWPFPVSLCGFHEVSNCSIMPLDHDVLSSSKAGTTDPITKNGLKP